MCRPLCIASLLLRTIFFYKHEKSLVMLCWLLYLLAIHYHCSCQFSLYTYSLPVCFGIVHKELYIKHKHSMPKSADFLLSEKNIYRWSHVFEPRTFRTELQCSFFYKTVVTVHTSTLIVVSLHDTKDWINVFQNN